MMTKMEKRIFNRYYKKEIIKMFFYHIFDMKYYFTNFNKMLEDRNKYFDMLNAAQKYDYNGEYDKELTKLARAEKIYSDMLEADAIANIKFDEYFNYNK